MKSFESSDAGYKAQISSLEAVESATPAEFVKAGLTEWKVDPTERAAFEAIGGKPVWEDWAKEMTGEGYNGQELLDTIFASIKKHGG